MLAGSGQVVSLVQERNMLKLVMIYDTNDMLVQVRLAIVRVLLNHHYRLD